MRSAERRRASAGPRYITVAIEEAASAKATGTPISSSTANTPNRIATAMAQCSTAGAGAPENRRSSANSAMSAPPRAIGRNTSPCGNGAPPWECASHPPSSTTPQNASTPPMLTTTSRLMVSRHDAHARRRHMQRDEESEVRFGANAGRGAEHHRRAHQQQHDGLGPARRVVQDVTRDTPATPRRASCRRARHSAGRRGACQRGGDTTQPMSSLGHRSSHHLEKPPAALLRTAASIPAATRDFAACHLRQRTDLPIQPRKLALLQIRLEQRSRRFLEGLAIDLRDLRRRPSRRRRCDSASRRSQRSRMYGTERAAVSSTSARSLADSASRRRFDISSTSGEYECSRLRPVAAPLRIGGW